MFLLDLQQRQTQDVGGGGEMGLGPPTPRGDFIQGFNQEDEWKQNRLTAGPGWNPGGVSVGPRLPDGGRSLRLSTPAPASCPDGRPGRCWGA